MAITQGNIPSSQASFAVDLKKKKVLVVEDFFSFRITVRRMLRSLDIESVDEASNGEEAVKKLSSKKYNIVLCDYNLGPGKDGQQVLEEARFREYIDNSTIFIMVTAENTTDMVMGALEYQPDDYLMKPFTKETLEKKIKNLVKKKENLQDLDKAVAKKDYDSVLALCDELISSHTKSLSDILKLKGEVLIKKGDYAAATAFYEKVLSMGNLPWAMLGLGKVKFISGDYEEAKSIFENVIMKNDKIVAAYDWLAKAHEKMGNRQEAQRVLQDAINISPKAILRQRALGNVAYKNNELFIAENCFKEAVKQGKHSFFKSPSDYTSLAKVYVDRNEPEEGLNVLDNAVKEFTDDPEASIHISLMESIAFKKMNREEDSKKAVEKAFQLSSTLTNKPPQYIELDFAKALLTMGDEESGKNIIRRIVQNNHEDQELIGNVQAVFNDLDIGDEGRKIVSMARDEIVKLNNDGVALVKKGDLSKAIEFFEQAVDNLPDNKIINANAAHALLLYMQQSGSQPHLLKKTTHYLDRVNIIDPQYKNLGNLMDMYKKLAQEA